MNDNALGGLLLITVGVGIAWLWYRGYFNTIIGKATGGLSSMPTSKPFAPKLGQ
jgi:hypothetical protein